MSSAGPQLNAPQFLYLSSTAHLSYARDGFGCASAYTRPRTTMYPLGNRYRFRPFDKREAHEVRQTEQATKRCGSSRRHPCTRRYLGCRSRRALDTYQAA